ncbi:MAG: Crp/Fnr family transcriptional regulator [Acidihalobacter sp.]
MDTRSWLEHFPALREIDDPAGLHALDAAEIVRVPTDTRVFESGQACHNYLLIIDGSIRVQQLSASGREIVLYRVEAGQGCVLTTSCLLAGVDRYPAEGLAETEVAAVVIPKDRFEDGLAHSAGFRNFVFSAYGRRLSELITLVEAVAFGRVDVRLAHSVLRRAGSENILAVTHQELAVELGSAREVISRQLKEFERRGWVKLSRGRIELRDRDALHELSITRPT